MSKLNITNTDIIKKTGWSAVYVSEVRHGKTSALGRLDEWCRVLKVSPETLIRLGRNSE